MTTTKTTESIPARSNPFADTEAAQDDLGFTPKAAKPAPLDLKVVDAIAKAAKFPSRQAHKPASATPEGEGEADGTPVKPKRGRRLTTGRNIQLNLKITEACKTDFYAMADAMRVPLAEAFEMAVEALKARKGKIKGS